MLHFILWASAIFAVSSRITVNAAHLRPRIIRGEDVSIEKAPYQVSVGFFNKKHACGGSIISENYVLTAGHCAENNESYYVRSGSSFSDSGGQIHSVVQVKRHEAYEIKDNNQPEHDIALMKISPAFELNNKTTKIIELYENEVKAGDVGYVVGWGLTEKSTKYEAYSQLQGVELNVIDFEECTEDYAFLGGMTNYSFCAEHPTQRQDFCRGDSGGAFVIKGKQAGIVSWIGPGCAIPGRPGVYTDVTKYLDWIKEHAKD